jgi:hypothetical protein
VLFTVCSLFLVAEYFIKVRADVLLPSLVMPPGRCLVVEAQVCQPEPRSGVLGFEFDPGQRCPRRQPGNAAAPHAGSISDLTLSAGRGVRRPANRVGWLNCEEHPYDQAEATYDSYDAYHHARQSEAAAVLAVNPDLPECYRCQDDRRNARCKRQQALQQRSDQSCDCQCVGAAHPGWRL